MRKPALHLFAALLVLMPPAQNSVESCFTSHVNAQRSDELTTREDLVALARKHSQRMASSGRIFHNQNLATEAPADWVTVGENVGVGPSCDAIHEALMNSPTHRRNIVDTDYNLIGVGVVTTPRGAIYVTQVFMQAPNSPTASVAGPQAGEGSAVPERTLDHFALLEDDRIPAEPAKPPAGAGRETDRGSRQVTGGSQLPAFIAASIASGL